MLFRSKFSNYVLNLIPPIRGDGRSPREILTGTKPDFKQSLPFGFADLCQVQNKKAKNNVNDFRTSSALALLPHNKGACYFASLSTGKIIIRDQFKIMDTFPPEFLIILKGLQERGAFSTKDLERDEPNENPTLTTDTTVDDDKKDNETKILTTITSSTDLEIKKFVENPNHLSFNQSVKKFGLKSTVDAMDNELLNIIEKEVLLPIPLKDQGKIPKGLIIPSSIFFKGKENGGKVEVKSRLVAGGHRQDRNIYEPKTSPTVKPQSIFILATFAARKRWHVATMDVKCAYLKIGRAHV